MCGDFCTVGMASVVAESADLTVNILCLHGKKQTGTIFENRISTIVNKFSAYHTARGNCSERFNVHFEFCDAPFELAAQDGDAVATRTWFSKTDRGDKSLDGLEELWSRGTQVGSNPYHGLFGFSEGACMALLACSKSKRFKGLRFAILSGGLIPNGHVLPPSSISVPSLHMYGMNDKVVLPKQSILLSRLFKYPVLHAHSKNHQVCQKREEIDAIRDFLSEQLGGILSSRAADQLSTSLLLRNKTLLQAHIESGPYAEVPDETMDELEALESIYMGEGEYDLEQENPPICSVKLLSASESHICTVKFLLGASYPDEPCKVILADVDEEYISPENAFIICDMLDEHARENVGMPMMCTLVEFLRGYMEDHPGELGTKRSSVEEEAAVDPASFKSPPQHSSSADGRAAEDIEVKNEIVAELLRLETCDSATQEELEKQTDRVIEHYMKEASDLAVLKPYYSSDQKGRWNYCIGLVGKPSAGKSTFFNGAINLENKPAVIGAYPFTTIEPNFGLTNISIHDPLLETGERVTSEITVRIKDVAGLVPGAYKGRGKGNKFLNDLLDADVLIHVVDASGDTDENGNCGSNEGDPLADIVWIHRELHRWIYGNVVHKWASILRKPQKFFRMFAGYHVTNDFIHEALARSDVDFQTVPEVLQSWSCSTLHQIIAHFIEIRFPVFLALNKRDKPQAKAHIERIGKVYPTCRYNSVSARVGGQLRSWMRDGVCESYSVTEPVSIKLLGEFAGNERIKLQAEELKSLLRATGPPNILKTVRDAMKMRWPRLVFPVSDVEDGKDKTLYLGLVSNTRFGDCIPFRHGSTIKDVFKFLTKEGILSGDFVRAEMLLWPQEKRKLVRKTELLKDAVTVVKISTNRKRQWQNPKRG